MLKKKTVRKKRAGRPKTEGLVYQTLKQCRESEKLTVAAFNQLRVLSPSSFTSSGRVKWFDIPEAAKTLAHMASGNTVEDSKEELEKLYLKKRINQTEVKTELLRDKYLEKDEVVQWIEASYSVLANRLQQLFATMAPKLQGLKSAEIQKRLHKEMPRVFQSLRELQENVSGHVKQSGGSED